MSISRIDSPETAIRRVMLRRWIDEQCQGLQTTFIESTGKNGGKEINQGELSGLLKSKSFGEKKARALEKASGMPAGYLNPAMPSHWKPPKAPLTAKEGGDAYGWPFSQITMWEYQNLLTDDDRAGVENLAVTLRNARAHGTKQSTPAHKTAT